MQNTNILSGVINFNRSIFTSTFEATGRLQDHALDNGEQVINQLGVVPEQICNAYDKATESFKAARSNFKTLIDESFEKGGVLFSKSA